MGHARHGGTGCEAGEAGVSEAALVNTVRLRFSRGEVRLFRNNVGEAWMGAAVRNPDGSVTIRKPMRVQYGLCVGSSDLIGWRSVTVTPEMVGHTVAVFVAAEGKVGRRKPTQEQQAFVDAVRAAGGRAGVFYSLDDVVRILSGEGT